MNNEVAATSGTLPGKLSVLPEPWIDRIFGRMEALYGSLFLERWRGTRLAEVKAVWASELSSFTDNPECFGLALKALLDECRFPPTLPEFVALCRKHYRRPTEAVAVLEHKLTAEDVERNRARAKDLVEKLGRRLAA